MRFWLGLLLMALAAYGVLHRLADLRSPGGEREPPAVADAGCATTRRAAGATLQLTERSGREFDSQELDGQVWVASFFFSSCPARA